MLDTQGKEAGMTIDWTKARSIELAWNDGHTPASLQVVRAVTTANSRTEAEAEEATTTTTTPITRADHSANDKRVDPPGEGEPNHGKDGAIREPPTSLSIPPPPPPPPQFLRWYPDFHCLEREAVYRMDDALDPTVLDDIYTYTTTKKSQQTATATTSSTTTTTTTTWGTYVTMKEIRAHWNTTTTPTTPTTNTVHAHHAPPPDQTVDDDTVDNDEEYQHRLALAVAADFVRHAIVHSSSTSTVTDGPSSSSSSSLSLSSLSKPTTCTRLSPTKTDTDAMSASGLSRVPLWTEQDCGGTNDTDTETNNNNNTTTTTNSHHVDTEGATTTSSATTAATMHSTAAHGVAVWCLSADVGSHVPYHMDYAELIRYETGVTVPPVLAGTIHCSRLVGKDNDPDDDDDNDDDNDDDETACAAAETVMVGGDYLVHTTNPSWTPSDEPNHHSNEPTTMTNDTTETPIVFRHYQTHGYKSILSSGAAWNESTTDHFPLNQWIRIPYRYNRMICHSGHLPHLSTRIQSMNVRRRRRRRAVTTTTGTSDPLCHTTPIPCSKRVVVGLNVFLHDVGPMVQQAPEHSEAFRRRVQRATPTTQTLNGSEGQGRRDGGFSLARLVANPQLSRRLVQAKREQYQRDYIAAQETLYERIREFLCAPSPQSHRPNSDSLPSYMVSVHQLLTALAPMVTSRHGGTTSAMSWPVTASDIHVYLHRQWQKGILVCARYSTGEDDVSNVTRALTPVLPSIDQKGLIEPNWLIGISESP